MCVSYLEEGSSSEEVQGMEEVEPCRVELWNEHTHTEHITPSPKEQQNGHHQVS